MSKQSKKVTKKKKDLKGGKKKRVKKLGLSKFIHSDRPKKKEKDVVGDSGGKQQIASNQNDEKKRVVISSRKQQQNLSLVDRCKLQMSSSLLRLVDEKLYTSESSNIPLTKEEFIAYHDAYSAVCEKWPTKPIDFIVKFIKRRLLTKKPLARIKFADIGCGREPLLKMKLPSKANVQSFDLVSTHEDIVQANMDNLPLEDESIDCAVYSLSLMAKDLGSIILETRRVMKTGGSLLIVEVTSRFEGRERGFVGRLEKVGFKKQSITPLKPNGYFTFFNFTKSEAGRYTGGSAFRLELKPCAYKAR